MVKKKATRKKKVTRKTFALGPTRTERSLRAQPQALKTPMQEIAELRAQAQQLLERAEQLSKENDLVFVFTYIPLAEEASDWSSSSWETSSC